jgi:hypothetical protein
MFHMEQFRCGKHLLAALVLCVAGPVSAANWFMSPTGSDSNACTSSGVACKTFLHTAALMSAGDTLCYATGFYNEQIIFGPAGVNKSGTSGNPITVQNCGGTNPVITNVGASKVAILLSHVSFITISGINVSGGQYVPFGNTNAAIRCSAASFAAGGAPNVAFFVSSEGSHDVYIQNADFRYAIGYNGIQATANYLASGQPWLTNPASVLSSHNFNVTIQGNTIMGLGNLLDQPGVCGDMIGLGEAHNYTQNSDHLYVLNNTISLADHDLINSFANNVVIQGNTLNNSWASLYSSPVAQGKGLPPGYRAFEISGNDGIIERNFVGPNGCCAGGNSNVPPMIEVHGQRNKVRRNVFHDAVANAINMDCGYGLVDQAANNFFYQNTFYNLGVSPFSTYTYSTDPCTLAGKHFIVNNIVYEDRQNLAGSSGHIVVQDTEVFTETANNGGLGNNNSITIAANLFAPSLTQPSTVTTRPSSIWNFGISGQQPLCLFQTGTTACPNSSTAVGAYPTFVFSNNIDAGITTSSRPVFVSGTPAAYTDYAIQGSSSGVDQGQFLAKTTSSGASTATVPIDNIGFFAVGDAIEFSTGVAATVTAVTTGAFPAGSLTVTPNVTFASGIGLAQPYFGSSPDMGAFEYAPSSLIGPNVLNNSNQYATDIPSAITTLLGTGIVGVKIAADMTATSSTTDPTFVADATNSGRTNYTITTSAVTNNAPYNVLSNPLSGYTYSVDMGNYAALLAGSIVNNWSYSPSSALPTSTPPPVSASTVSPSFGGGTTGGGIEFGMTSAYLGLPTSTAFDVASSMAGILVAMQYNHPTWNWFDIKGALRQTASNWATGYDRTNYGYGNVGYTAATAISAPSAIYLQPPGMTVANGGSTATITLYPYRQTRRVKEAIYSVSAAYTWPVKNEYTAADIATSGATLLYTSNGTDVTPVFNYAAGATGTVTFIAFTVDNATLGSANFSRAEPFSESSQALTVGTQCLH